MGSAQDAAALCVHTAGHSLILLSIPLLMTSNLPFARLAPLEQQAEVFHRNVHCNAKTFSEQL